MDIRHIYYIYVTEGIQTKAELQADDNFIFKNIIAIKNAVFSLCRASGTFTKAFVKKNEKVWEKYKTWKKKKPKTDCSKSVCVRINK